MIKPLPGYVLIEPIEDETKTSSGFYKPETSKDKPSKGKVVAIGFWTYEWLKQWNAKKTALPTKEHQLLRRGETVVYKKYTNQEVEYDGKKYLLVHFDELLGVIDD